MNKCWTLLVVLALPVGAADRIFTGSLERLRPASISIRMDGGLVVDAVLPSGFAVPYHLADQVEMVCAPSKTVYDTASGLHFNLRVISLRLVRPASPEERIQEAGSESPAELERVRKVNLDYAGKVPNFVADETNKRYRSDDVGRPWRLLHIIESEVVIKDGRVSRQNLRRDGKPWKNQRPGIASDFGLHLAAVFEPNCHTSVKFAGRQESGGMPMLVYSFTAPANGCFWTINRNGNKYTPAVSGRVLVDAEKGNIVRCEFESIGFPERFGIDRYTVTESWGYVTIGTSSYLVPVSTEATFREVDGAMERQTVEYRNHRHFESSTNVTFH